jgi:hypothetical protein
VDQVIDKYKFSASNVAVGTVSKSPAYIVGPDDVGQCFSVGGVAGGGTASLYYNGATNPVASTQLAKLGDRMELGLSVPSATGTASAFIQRSAPLAYGTCPTVAPTTGLTRVQKYSVLTASGLLYVWYAYSGDTPVPYEAWASDALAYLHTSANRNSWGTEVKATDIKSATQITRTVTGSTISIGRGTALKGMKVDITVAGMVAPWSTIMFNYTCSLVTCTVGDVWSETPGVTAVVQLTP